MEQKDIQFNQGIKRTPSLAVEDGDLSECVNLIPNHGELVNVKPAEEIDGIELRYNATKKIQEKLLLVHETAKYKHYITCHDEGKGFMVMYWAYSEDSKSWGPHYTDVDARNIKQVIAIGNALAIIYEKDSDTPMEYLLWDGKQYTELTKKPDVNIDFKLTGDIYGRKYDSTFKIAPMTANNESGGNYKDAVASVELAAYTEYHDDEEAQEYYFESTLTTDNLKNIGLVAVRDYQLTNKTGWHPVYVDVVDSTIKYKVHSVLGLGKSMSFKYSEHTEIKIWRYGSGPMKSIGVGSVIFEGQMDAEKKSGDATVEISKSDEGDSFKAVMGDTKDFISLHCYERNRFIFPFFVRYGLKHFDGSISDLSEPILMLPNSGKVPQLLLNKYDGTKETVVDSIIVSFVCDLNMRFSLEDANYKKWKDIITGVVIGISSPIYYYNEGEEYSSTKVQGKVWEGLSEEIVNDYGIIDGQKISLYDKANDMYEDRKAVLIPPAFSDNEYKDNYLKSNIFYKIKEYSWKDIEELSGWQKVNDDSISLKNLATYPTISDSYNDTYSLYPEGAFSYNNRLNIYNIKLQPSTPNMTVSPILENDSETDYRCIFFISYMGQETILKSAWVSNEPYPKWIYYGNTNAKICRICQRKKGEDGTTYEYKTADVNMTTHPWLNGSYAIIEDNGLDWNTLEDVDPEDTNVMTYEDNSIYASNANNPFYFPILTQNKVGTGAVKAVSTAAKALSQGQFGEFPLYAFTTDGIWALDVNDEGQYTTKNPVSRDVVTNPDSVCQIDDSVVYACSQGLKQLSGSETRKLSEVMEGVNVDESKFLKGIDKESELVVKDTESIVNMLSNCKVMYDPAGGRKLHIYPSDCATTGKHYIYDFENDAWSTAVGDDSKQTAIVPSYPFSTFQVGQKLYQYTNTEDADTLSTVRYGVLLTREMSFGNPFVMKMLADLRMIYTKNNNDSKCKIAVFVSNDRVNWKQLTSLRKHSYKWYRFRIQTALTDQDALTAVTCLVDETKSNKLM